MVDTIITLFICKKFQRDLGIPKNTKTTMVKKSSNSLFIKILMTIYTNKGSLCFLIAQKPFRSPFIDYYISIVDMHTFRG